MKMNVRIDGQSFAVEVGDLRARPVQVSVDGEKFEVWVEADSSLSVAEGAPVVQPAASLNMPAPVMNQAKTVPAPIPGVIVSVSVREGDSVVFGQELCVLEAMKMKNLIKANRPGKIAVIHIAAGDQVRHGQALMEYSD